MKRILFLGLFIGITFISFSQSIQDKQILVQMSIDNTELQPYLKVNSQIVIKNNGVVLTGLTLSKFGKPILFMTEEELFFNNRKDYIEFQKFDISNSSADIVFKYDVGKITVFSSLEKIKGQWTLKTNQVKQ
jgi:hypothetical protein